MSAVRQGSRAAKTPVSHPVAPIAAAPVPAVPARRRALPVRLWRSLQFIKRNRLYGPNYWVMGARFLLFKIRNPHIVTEGFVFLGPKVEVYARRGYGRLVIGKWVWIGKGNAIRCHEGTLRIGPKTVFGAKNTINCYLDIEIGHSSIFADWIYICDFDHRFDDLTIPIKDQGIIKSPVKIGNDVWVGEKATVLRGVTVGDGSVVASHALVNRDVPPRSIVGGVPAKVLKTRGTGGPQSSAPPGGHRPPPPAPPAARR